MSDVEVSVVLPAYNEEATIERTVEVTLETLARRGPLTRLVDRLAALLVRRFV